MSARKYRWMAFRGKYFDIRHIEGKGNKVVDALSRNFKKVYEITMSQDEIDQKVKEATLIYQNYN